MHAHRRIAAIAIGLIGTATLSASLAMAQAPVRPPLARPSTSVRAPLPASTARPIPVLRAQDTRPPASSSGLRLRATASASALRLLTEAEKRDFVSRALLAPGMGHVPIPKGVMTKAVLTPQRPLIPGQATVVEAPAMLGSYLSEPPTGSNAGEWIFLKSDYWRTLTINFLPFRPGQLTVVVFHMNGNKSTWMVNGHRVDEVDDRVAFAVVPDSTDPVHIALYQADDSPEGIVGQVRAVEIIVAD